jgi:hypothetical protein
MCGDIFIVDLCAPPAVLWQRSSDVRMWLHLCLLSLIYFWWYWNLNSRHHTC